MNLSNRNRISLLAALVLPIFLSLTLSGCSERDFNELTEATAVADPDVFIDAFGVDLDYSAFEYSYYDALTLEDTGGYNDTPTIKITIPEANWAGGSFWTHNPRDLSTFNALTFYAKATQSMELGECGIGIPIVDNADYQTTAFSIPLEQEWTQVIIPIPNSARLTSERGMFWFSHGGGGVGIWFDEVKFAEVSGIQNPEPVINTASVDALLGEIVPIEGASTTYQVGEQELEVAHSPYYFTYYSADESVAVAENGRVTAVGGGTTTITAKLITANLDTTDVEGIVTVTVIAPPSSPAPAPALDQADVISIYSDSYTNVTVDSWLAEWTFGGIAVFDQQIQGDNVKAYTGFNIPTYYTGIEFTNDLIDAESAGMTHIHMDVFASAGTQFGFKIVDFGSDGVWGGGNDTERAFNVNSGSTPQYVTGEWMSLDIPLTEFSGMNFEHISQLVLANTNSGSLWLDNIYFHK
ncbi:MAG: hypothetical protein GY752_04245 [bacterium]|nr:hypothetical protein [bacterium]MCP4799123.1 hypothetical protein [bacterium]